MASLSPCSKLQTGFEFRNLDLSQRKGLFIPSYGKPEGSNLPVPADARGRGCRSLPWYLAASRSLHPEPSVSPQCAYRLSPSASFLLLRNRPARLERVGGRPGGGKDRWAGFGNLRWSLGLVLTARTDSGQEIKTFLPVCSSVPWGLYLLSGYVWGFKCEAPVCGLC